MQFILIIGITGTAVSFRIDINPSFARKMHIYWNCGLLELRNGEIERAGKEWERVAGRSLACYWAVREIEFSMVEVSRSLRLSLSGVSQSVRRGEELVRKGGYKLNVS